MITCFYSTLSVFVTNLDDYMFSMQEKTGKYFQNQCINEHTFFCGLIKQTWTLIEIAHISNLETCLEDT